MNIQKNNSSDNSAGAQQVSLLFMRPAFPARVGGWHGRLVEQHLWEYPRWMSADIVV